MTANVTAEELRARLRERIRTNEEWLATLNQRKLEELKFHDQDRDVAAAKASQTDDHARDTSNRKYYTTTQLSKTYIQNWIAAHAPGKIVLDYACGNAVNGLLAAEAGAALVIGLDISAVSIRNCCEKAAQKGLANTCFIQGDCENTGFPANSVDVVICSGMLHHLELSYAFFELRRIMKPGAVLLGVEALGYNPIITLYRELTPHLRTEFEKDHILSLRDLDFAARFFKVQNVRFWHLASIGAVVFRRLPFFGVCLSMANALDSVLLRMPLIRRLAWMFTFELVKRPNE